DELIIGLIVGDRITNPAGKQRRARTLFGRGISAPSVLQDVGPFQGKVTGIFRTVEQAINQSGSFVASGIGKILTDFVRRRQSTTDVDGYSAQKCQIIRWQGRYDV